MLKRLLILMLLIVCAPAHAMDWQKIRGSADDITINKDGKVYAVGQDRVVWRWRNEQARWSKISGKLKRIAIGPKGRVWGVGVNNHIYRRNGLWWDELNEQAIDISVGPDGSVVRSDLHDVVSIRDKFSNRWKTIHGRKAVRVAALGKGKLWIIQRDGKIARFDGKFWQDMPGEALDIAHAPGGGIYIASLEGPLNKWDQEKSRWVVVEKTQNASSLAVGPDEKPWYVTYGGDVYASSLFPVEQDKKKKTEKRPPATTGAQTTDHSPIVFKKVSGKSVRLRIGGDGSIFSLSANGDFQRWNNKQKKFRDFPGTVVRFGVDPSGLPWVVNSKREIFKHTGKNWKNITGSALDIAVSFNGDVIISDPNENLYRLNNRHTAFKRIYGKGAYVAVHPNGDIWTIRLNGKIYRCTDQKCVRLKKTGVDLSIGPDGSVFMVDINKKLFRFDEKKKDWKRVETSRAIRTVGVGPKGRPWVGLTNSDVYSSTTFERDESDDLKLANSTSKPTNVTSIGSSSSSSIFTFTKKITFNEVTVSFALTDTVSIGLDGLAYVIGDGGNKINSYNESKKTLENLNFSFPEDTKVAFNDGDEQAWYLSSSNNNKIGHQKKKNGSSFKTYNFDSSAGIGLDFAIGGDGSVFAVSSDNTIYKYDRVGDDFDKFDNDDATNIAVDVSGNPWIIEKTSQLVKYWNGSTFVKPGNKSQKATDIAIGASGKLYIADTNNDLKKWNATNDRWDDVTIKTTTANGNNGPITNADVVAVDDDGRPWIIFTSGSGHAYRAKD